MKNYNLIKNFLSEKDERMKKDLIILSGITIHDTDNKRPGTGAQWHSRYMKTEHCKNRHASWHFSVDDMTIVQSLPVHIRGLHTGTEVGNDRTIGIEICVNADSDILSATEKAAELTADLLIEHGLTVKNVYRHLGWSGKMCPAQLLSGKPYSWEIFLERVEHYIDEQTEEPEKIKIETKTESKSKIKILIKAIKDIINAIKKNRV